MQCAIQSQTNHEIMEKFLAPYDMKTFITQRLGRHVTFIKGDNDKFSDLFDWSSLEYLLQSRGNTDLNHVFLKHGEDTIRLDTQIAGRLGQMHSVIDVSKLATYLPHQSTLVFNTVDYRYPPINRLIAAYEDIFQTRANANLYAAFGAKISARGVHWDQHDVFVLHISGQKLWRVWERINDFPLNTDVDEITPPGEKIFEDELNPGDILYLPRGTWHDTTTTGRHALHFTFSSRRRVGQDFLAWLLKKFETNENSALQTDIPIFAGSDDRTRFVEKLRHTLVSNMTLENMDQFLDESAPDPVRRLPVAMPWIGSRDVEALALDSHVYWRARRIWIDYDGKSPRLRSRLAEMPFEPGEIAFAESLCEQRDLTIDEFAADATDRPALIAFLHKCMASGLIVVTSSPSSRLQNTSAGADLAKKAHH